jgi:hypothetical protein
VTQQDRVLPFSLEEIRITGFQSSGIWCCVTGHLDFDVLRKCNVPISKGWNVQEGFLEISNLFLIDNASVTAAVFGDMVQKSTCINTKGPSLLFIYSTFRRVYTVVTKQQTGYCVYLENLLTSILHIKLKHSNSKDILNLIQLANCKVNHLLVLQFCIIGHVGWKLLYQWQQHRLL